MIHRIEIYLDQVASYAGLPCDVVSKARDEIADHLLSRVADLKAQGATQDDAALRAVYEHGHAADVGYSLRPRWRLIDVRMRGTARGIFAVGPRAVGIFSCGFVSTGVISLGVVSLGVFSLGLLSLALFGIGAIAIAPVAMGLNAIGFLAIAVNAAGILCSGVNCVGMWVYNGRKTLSFYNDANVPELLRAIANSVNFTNAELMWSCAPTLVLVGLVAVGAIYFGQQEHRRIQRTVRRSDMAL